MPKSKRRDFVTALDQVRKTGRQDVFDDVTYFPIKSCRRITLKPQTCWEINYAEKGQRRRLRFYFCIDFNMSQELKPYLDVANTADGRQILSVVKHVPRLLYVGPIPRNGRHQRAGYKIPRRAFRLRADCRIGNAKTRIINPGSKD